MSDQSHSDNPNLERVVRRDDFTFVPINPDWWRCLRLGGISGRYDGTNGKTGSGARALDLRIDIDSRHANSPVMNRVSGDFYNIRSISIPIPVRAISPGPLSPWKPRTWRIYQESWIIDEPKVKWERCKATITGSVRFWKGAHLHTNATIVVTWGGSDGVQAQATFSSFGGSTTYQCKRISDCFRSMNLEIDVCDSVNAEPILPSYDTHWLTDRPADTPQRTLTVEECYRETGVCVTVSPNRTIINDSAATFDTWSVGELHDAMESYFSRYTASWPRWDMWGLLAGRFVSAGTAGIMFDAAATYGGAGEAPDRQGFAVFRNHWWFNDLVSGAPTNDAQRTAMRTFLYTYVHEAGHAFNLLHSWNKGRPDSRSWMNYPHNIAGFYDDFYFRFDDEELIHIRHGDRASVIMGGDDWASGGHMDDSSIDLLSAVEGEPPLEVLLRSKGHFDFMEPVRVEVRLRNLLPEIPLEVDTRLQPEHGVVAFVVQRPDGRILEHDPVFCQIGESERTVLKGATMAKPGEDRYSQSVVLSYGKHGFSFSEPGEYRVRAFYGTDDGFVFPSNTLRIRVGRPYSREEDKLAQDYFSKAVGLILALGDPRSPFLESGANTLQELWDRMKATPAAAETGMILGGAYGRPFHRVEETKGKVPMKLVQTAKADAKRALELTEPALSQYSKDAAPTGNLAYHELVRIRAQNLKELGKAPDAKKEVATLRKNLEKRGVHTPVLKDIQSFEKKL